MKNFNHLFKTLLFLFALFCTSLSYSQPCVPMPNSPGASDLIYTLSNSNAVAVVSMGEIGGYKTYKYTISPYDTGLTGKLKFRNNIESCEGGCLGGLGRSIKIKKDLIVNYAEGSDSNTIEIEEENLPVGPLGTIFEVKAYCGFFNYKTLKIKILVVKEPMPTYSLTFAAYCKKNNFSDLYNGYIGFSVTGSHSNSGKIKLIVTPPSDACSTESHYLGGLDIDLPYKFYNCNTNGTYTIKLKYYSSKLGGGSIERDLGTVFTWRKRFYSCDNLQGGNTSLPQLKTSIIAPNPASDYIVLNYNVVTESAKVTIFDLNNNVVNTIELDKKNQEHKIEINKLEKGIYILKIEDGETHTIERFIKS